MFAVPGRVPGMGIGFDLAVKPARGDVNRVVANPEYRAEQQPCPESHLQRPNDGIPALAGHRVNYLDAGCDHYQEYEYGGGPAEDVFLFFGNLYHFFRKNILREIIIHIIGFQSYAELA